MDPFKGPKRLFYTVRSESRALKKVLEVMSTSVYTCLNPN
jgi:hypothetical protein